MSLTYSTYLKLDQLLDLQQPVSQPPEHDESLFIVIHQVYELWFKLVLHEFEKIKRDFSDNNLFGAIATFKRARMIMKTMVGQLDILETMTPMSFTSFRDRLEKASGLQSSQFRELEFILGMKRADVLDMFDPRSAQSKSLRSRLRQRSLVDHWYGFLQHQGISIPQELRERDVTLPAMPHEAVQTGILHLYRTRPDVAILFELMTDLDEGFQEWRYRHVKLAERTIGQKPGTGGSTGVEFLKRTLFKPVFPDLWAIRYKL